MDNSLVKAGVENSLPEQIAQLRALVNDLISRLPNREAASDSFEGLGLMNEGEMRFGEGEPGLDFTGLRIGYPGFDYNGQTWHLVGTYLEKLMFGISATEGAGIFAGGRGTIDDDGITLLDLLTALQFKSTTLDASGNEIARYGRIEMLIPDGGTTPVLAFTISDEPAGTVVISNGNFASGDLTGWTDSGATFSVVADKGPTNAGEYALEADDLTTDTETTLTAVSSDTTAGDRYSFEFYTKDTYLETDIPAEANVGLDSANADFAMGSLGDDFKDDGWCEAGNYLGQGEQVSLIKFDIANYASEIMTADEVGLVWYLRKGGLSVGTAVLALYRMLVEWVFGEATWNDSADSTAWNTAGAKGALDRESDLLGEDTITANDVPEGYRYTDLDPTLVQEWIDGTADNYGLGIWGGTSGNNAVEIGLRENDIGSFLRVIERSRYKIEVEWYDTSGGSGTLIRTDVIATANDVSNWNRRSITLTAPEGSASFKMIITRGKGRKFWMTDCVVKRIGVFTRMYFSPFPTLQDNRGTMRLLATKKELNNPATAPTAEVAYFIDDEYSKSLLHFNGNDASTTFTDESGKAWTRTGNAEIDTAQSVFGGASGYFDGNGDYISTGDSDDWRIDGGSNSNLWTVDFRIRYAADPGAGQSPFCSQQVDKNNWWGILLYNNLIHVAIVNGGSAQYITFAWNPAANTWYHLAIVKDGKNGYMAFVNGTQVGTTQVNTTTIPNFAGSFYIGRVIDVNNTTNYHNGWIDEFRLSKGIARWTSNFTPPTQEYATADPGNMGIGAYKYKVTFIDESGETAASTESNEITTTSVVRQSILTNIPIGPTGTTGRRIYRTEAGGSIFKFLHEITDNTTTTYEDNIADADLGATEPPVNNTSNRPQMPRAVYIPARLLVSNATLTETVTDTVLISTSAANAADGDTFDAMAWIEGGTYTLKIHGRKETTAGKFDVYIDGVLASSGNDAYASAANFMFSISDVAISGSGYHTIRIKINTKNGSSSDYTFGCYGMYFIPSAY